LVKFLSPKILENIVSATLQEHLGHQVKISRRRKHSDYFRQVRCSIFDFDLFHSEHLGRAYCTPHFTFRRLEVNKRILNLFLTEGVFLFRRSRRPTLAFLYGNGILFERQHFPYCGEKRNTTTKISVPRKERKDSNDYFYARRAAEIEIENKLDCALLSLLVK
jgi:hypothetical protein